MKQIKPVPPPPTTVRIQRLEMQMNQLIDILNKTVPVLQNSVAVLTKQVNGLAEAVGYDAVNEAIVAQEKRQRKEDAERAKVEREKFKQEGRLVQTDVVTDQSLIVARSRAVVPEGEEAEEFDEVFYYQTATDLVKKEILGKKVGDKFNLNEQLELIVDEILLQVNPPPEAKADVPPEPTQVEEPVPAPAE